MKVYVRASSVAQRAVDDFISIVSDALAADPDCDAEIIDYSVDTDRKSRTNDLICEVEFKKYDNSISTNSAIKNSVRVACDIVGIDDYEVTKNNSNKYIIQFNLV